MAHNYRDEDVLRHTKDAFVQTIKVKLEQLYRYVKKGSNTELTGNFIEELVRGFIQKWIGHRQLLNGTFYSTEFKDSGKKPLQIDGIVYDPNVGPRILQEGNFVIVHPVFCTSVIEIKTSIGTVNKFEGRLKDIYNLYMHHVTKPQVMGVVIHDPNPEEESKIKMRDGQIHYAFDYQTASWCPIFILFKKEDNEYEPYEPAIDAMIRAVFKNQINPMNYL